jgi:hypothetical protein
VLVRQASCTVNGSGDPLVVLANAGCSTGYVERFGERLPRSQIIAINMAAVGETRSPDQTLIDNRQREWRALGSQLADRVRNWPDNFEPTRHRASRG